jgi:hypothetical protein
MKSTQVQEAATARDLLDRAHGEPVLLREGNGRAFVLVEVHPDDVETYALADNATMQRILDGSRALARREGWLSTEQVRKELNIR